MLQEGSNDQLLANLALLRSQTSDIPVLISLASGAADGLNESNPVAALARHMTINRPGPHEHAFTYIGCDGMRRTLTKGHFV